MKNMSLYELWYKKGYSPDGDHEIKYISPGAYPSAVITSMNDTHYATIEDTFENSAECLMVVSVVESTDLKSDKVVELSFRDISGTVHTLRCIVDWFLKTASMYKKILYGLKLVNPTTGCREFLKTRRS